MDENYAISPLVLFRNSYVVELLFCGAIALLTIFIGVLFIRSREKLYFYYLLFLLFSLLAAVINVMAYDWRYGTLDFSSDLMRKNLELVTLLGLFAYCLFTLSLLAIKKQDIQLHRWIMTLAVVTACYGFLYWLFHDAIKAYETEFFIGSRMVIIPMSLLAIIGVSYRTQSAFKSYFIVGSLFYLMGALVGVLRETVSGLGIPHFYDFTASAYFYFGIFLEIICFTLALNHRVYLIHLHQKRKNEGLKKRALYERDLALVQVLGSQEQTNPHFIFNQFSAIKYLIQRQENSKAIKLLMAYSRFIREVLDAGEQIEIALEEELTILHQYLRLEAMRKGDNFSYEFSVDPAVDLKKTRLPPIILQPYIEQVIWKELQLDDQTQKRLYIGVKEEEGAVIIDIRLSMTKEEVLYDLKELKKGRENLINNERLRIYNRSHRHKINCYREDLKAIDGLTAAILIVFLIDNQQL